MSHKLTGKSSFRITAFSKKIIFTVEVHDTLENKYYWRDATASDVAINQNVNSALFSIYNNQPKSDKKEK